MKFRSHRTAESRQHGRTRGLGWARRYCLGRRFRMDAAGIHSIDAPRPLQWVALAALVACGLAPPTPALSAPAVAAKVIRQSLPLETPEPGQPAERESRARRFHPR